MLVTAPPTVPVPVSDPPVSVTELDDERAILFASDQLQVAEQGETIVNVRLSVQPAADVEVTIARASGDTVLDVSGATTLTFSPDDWNVEQPVAIAAP